MCGIAGILSLHPGKLNRSDISIMTSAIAHRGPDGEAHWMNADSRVLLGHRRLAIIDLSNAAAQPMHYHDRYSIVHNGEIYNYRELRDQLLSKGYIFKTQSDTEVILAAYHCYGNDCVDQFNGMFAFAIWDEQEQKLFAARDRFGEKPFYFAYDENNTSFYFASEIKALWAAGIKKEIDESMVINYLALGLTSHPLHKKQTFYKNIFSLPAAHYIDFHIATITNLPNPVHYWKETAAPRITDELERIEKFREMLYRSVSLRLRSDVSIGTSLSGGLDSSSIVSSIHHQPLGVTHYNHQSFTAVFEGFEKDERVAASEIADQFKLATHFVFPNATDFASEIEKLIIHHEEPIGSASVYAQFKVFELAKQKGVTVLLDGQGADELLGGYTKYIHWYLQELFAAGRFSAFQKEKTQLEQTGVAFDWGSLNYIAAMFPGITTSQLQKRATDKVMRHPWMNKDYVKEFFDADTTVKPNIRTLNDILLYQSAQTGLDELLRYADKNSMAHGREVRLPFLDHFLAEYIYSLPSDYKIHNGYTKWVLRKSMNGILPDNIVWNANKTAFEPPQQQWMSNPVVMDQIRASKEILVNNKVLTESVLKQKIQPHSAYAAECNDWRYLVCGILYK